MLPYAFQAERSLSIATGKLTPRFRGLLGNDTDVCRGAQGRKVNADEFKVVVNVLALDIHPTGDFAAANRSGVGPKYHEGRGLALQACHGDRLGVEPFRKRYLRRFPEIGQVKRWRCRWLNCGLLFRSQPLVELPQGRRLAPPRPLAWWLPAACSSVSSSVEPPPQAASAATDAPLSSSEHTDRRRIALPPYCFFLTRDTQKVLWPQVLLGIVRQTTSSVHFRTTVLRPHSSLAS